jgi:hypothetical protein
VPSSNTSIGEGEHGTTYGAAQRCKVVYGSACHRCAPLIAEYMRQCRASNPEMVERNRVLSRARSRAMTKLAELYPAHFEALYRAELDRERMSVSGSVESSESG